VAGFHASTSCAPGAKLRTPVRHKEISTMLDDVLKELRTNMDKAIESLRRDLAKVRTGRAHAGMLDSIRVDYYGVPTPVHQMATVSVPEPRLITVKPWEKGQVKADDKAIRDGDL